MIGNRPTAQSRPEPMRPLPRPYLSILQALREAGGEADLDLHGRLVVGVTKHPLQGGPVEWLQLVSRGLVAGRNGRMVLTEAGIDELLNRSARVSKATV